MQLTKEMVGRAFRLSGASNTGRFIYDAYLYAEESMICLAEIEFWRMHLLIGDRVSPVVADYIIDILAGRANPIQTKLLKELPPDEEGETP